VNNNKINIITSFPKSGNTWIRFIIYDLFFNDNNILTENSLGIKKKVPDFHNVELKNNQILFSNELKDKNIFIKTHFSFNQMKKFQINKVIILIRNPYDVLVSLFNYYELNKDVKSAVIDYFCLNYTLPFFKRFNFPDWKEHFESWINSGKNYHIVRYEDLIDDFENQIKILCNFLEINVSEAKIQFIKKNTSFENLKNVEIKEREKNIEGFFFDNMNKKKTSFINKGGYGNYKLFFNSSELTKLENSFKKIIEKFKI
tara:strand:+ start:50 stop:823 length:774 start_codon:yes stop_codon:yes gene_type:complete